MKKIIFAFAALFFSALLFTTCTKEEAAVQLKISPDSLVIVDSDTLKGISISSEPKANMEFKITQKPVWLSIEPLSGTINGSALSLKIRPLKDSLVEGIYKGKISIITNNAGTFDLPVTLSVNGHPKIKTNMSALIFPENISETNFSIENSGTGILNWSIENTTNWITLSTSSGYLYKGQKKSLKISCNRNNLDQNTYTSNLTIKSNSEIQLQPIPISMVVPRISAMKLNTTNILFDYFCNSAVVCLKNTGNTGFNWTATNQNYYNLTPNTGTLVKGDSININISLNRGTLQTGIINSDIYITNSDNLKDTIRTVINHFVDTKWIMDKNIIDAEFCRYTNKIVIVSANPSTLSIIDPDAKTIQSLNLSYIPTCVAINKNGDHAAVGHNGHVTLVNLNTVSVEMDYPINCAAIDIILTGSGWMYVIPTEQWALYSINPQTGAESFTSGGYSAGYTERLNPSEKSIYTADIGNYPSDLFKYSIGNGVAQYVYDSPYHGDYSNNGSLWFYENGEKMVTRGNTVLNVTDTKASDMIYYGLISNNPYNLYNSNIETLFQSKSADKTFFITQAYTSNDTYGCDVYVYNSTYLTFLTRYRLEKFLVPVGQTGGKIYDAVGKFVFVNTTGTKIYVLANADPNSGLSKSWALENIDVN